MSFVPVIRDYVEVINTLSQNTGGLIQPIEFIRESAMYLFKTIQFGLVYILTLQWVHDFSLLPINIPQISISLFSENLFLDNPESSFFAFLEIPSIKQNSLFLGFFNSFFLTLPISIVHVITLRRLYIKGIPAATYSIAGYIVGQLFCIGCVIFGFRGIINSWFSFEPFNYIIGLIIIFRVIYAMTQENLREIEGWNNPQYTNFFVTTFILAWCEQTSILQYIGNLSFNPNASLLEISALAPTFSSYIQHLFYLIGLGVGSICFTILWGLTFLFIKNSIIKYTPIFISSFVQQINRGTFVIAIALSLSSIPFYGLDYLLTGPLGFVSQDRVFKNTVFDQYNIKDSVVGLGISSQFDSVDIDVSPFDRGRYTLYPEKVFPFSFEDLNYRGEAEWTNRFDKVSTVTDSRAGFLSLSKILKKPNSSETNKVEQNTNQNLLPPISTFSSKIAPNNDLGLETKDTRFSEWYTLDQTLPAEEGPSIETTFSEGQDITFPLDFTRIASFEPGNIDLKIKQKYYSSQVYKNLLALDIDLFLNRQPNKFKLSSDNEIDLFTKRRILTSYYDSLRDYSKLPYSSNFENFFNGSKSFTNKVYNQQFKGTLRSVSRLFSLTSSDETNKLVLKFDQPLYQDRTYSAFHEELEPNLTGKTNNLLNAPLYGGWDETARKFVLTNKLLPKSNTETVIIPEMMKSSFTTVNSTTPVSKKIKFTTWPLTQEITNQGKTKSNIPFSTLYVPENEYEGTNDPAFESLSTLPLNWETMQRRSASAIGKTYENIFDYLAPQRGGFIWPGTSNFNIKFTKS